jgi:dipeptidyl aminopeptidase/acylaminoacyl peptidase
VVEADDKHSAQINCIAHLLSKVPYLDVMSRPVKLPTRQPDGGYERPDLWMSEGWATVQAEPWDAAGEYTNRSPVYHAHKCKTPTLILHGEDDLCTPLGQAFELYNALVEGGCEAELVVYPREGHGWSEREHQLDSWNRIRDWLARYLAP